LYNRTDEKSGGDQIDFKNDMLLPKHKVFFSKKERACIWFYEKNVPIMLIVLIFILEQLDPSKYASSSSSFYLLVTRQVACSFFDS
jgi:hypothetical protein